ncbi:siroheme decarboxylase subunit beta [Roseicella frigidaeris]|nr:AsnC family transcriptional regulator [Roseicella frigidaeris]
MDEADRRIVAATQDGLPLVPRPYHAVAAAAGLTPEEVMARMHRLLAEGAIRRIGAVPNHYALGYRFNGMAVWEVAEERVDALGARIAALGLSSHCYRRPRHPPDWPYNLFTMVHGRTREEALHWVETIAVVLGEAVRAREVLFSSRILKKTGLRLVG